MALATARTRSKLSLLIKAYKTPMDTLGMFIPALPPVSYPNYARLAGLATDPFLIKDSVRVWVLTPTLVT